MTNGAGEAALAALRIHSQPQGQTAQPRAGSARHTGRRANSLMGDGYRSNSLRSYTYNPTASYTVGQPLNAGAGAPRRVNSLNTKSSTGSYGFQRPGQRLNSMGSYSRSAPAVYEKEDEEDEGDVTITTKTTKVVDGQGRTQSITVETMKTLADGSTVTNTTTKNISRSNSRANSLNSQSLTHKPSSNNSMKHNSLLSNGGGTYNLSKIDEDLQDFDYNYELDNNTLTPIVHGHDRAFGNQDHDQKLKLNHGISADLDDGYDQQLYQPHAFSNESSNTRHRSLTSTDSSRPLKSILKKKINGNDGVEDDAFTGATDGLRSNQIKSDQDESSHPYASLGGKTLGSPANFKVPGTPESQNMNGLTKGPNTNVKQPHSPFMSPVSRHDDILSDKSVSSRTNSIKFSDKHETIPNYYDDNEQPEKPTERDLYSKAMQVAMERVYGNKEKEPLQSLDISQPSEADGTRATPLASKSLADHILKKDKKLHDTSQQGISDNYTYQNHHKDFVGLSLRDKNEPKQSSRKERANDEKKQHKSEIKEQKHKEKEKAKMEAEANKAASKEQKKAHKSHKHGKFTSLFGRGKGASNDENSDLEHDQLIRNESESQPNDVISQPISDSNQPINIANLESNTGLQSKSMTEKPTAASDSSILMNSGKPEPISEAFIPFNETIAQYNSIGGQEQNSQILKQQATEPALVNQSSNKDFSTLDPSRTLPTSDKNLGYPSNKVTETRPVHGSDEITDNNPDHMSEKLFDSNSSTFSVIVSRLTNLIPETIGGSSATSEGFNVPESHQFDKTVSQDGKTFSPSNAITQDSQISSNQVVGTDLRGNQSEIVQVMPGSLPGVDESTLRAIVQDDSGTGPLFNLDIGDTDNEVKKGSVNTLPQAVEQSSVMSNNANEKRKGKVLNPIAVPVLNEIVSETTSLGSQSNRYSDIYGVDDSEEFVDSEDIKDIPEVGQSSTAIQNREAETLSPTVKDGDDIDESPSSTLKARPEDDTGSHVTNTLHGNKLYGDESKQTTIPSSDNKFPSPSVANTNNIPLAAATIAANPSMSPNRNITEVKTNSNNLSQAAAATANIQHPMNGDVLTSENQKQDILPETAAAYANQSSTSPAINKVNENGIYNNGKLSEAAATTANHEELSSPLLPKSSFEHIQGQELESPIVINDDVKSPKKGSKFKQKLFKYFVNSYER